jgi:Fic family protein
MAKVSSTFKKISSLRERCYKAAVGKQNLLALIGEVEVAEQVYNSNAIENNSEREIFKAKNLARVVSYIDKKAKEQELNLEVVLLLHKMLLANILEDGAGRFRKNNEWVKVGNYIAVDPKEITERLERMFAKYYAESHQNIIKRIALLHLSFEHIHPFVDGNGRIGRVINNYLLIREGFVPINIKFMDRKLYYEAFREFDQKGKTAIMEEIVGKAITNSYHKRLAYLEGLHIITLADYAKKYKISHSNLINKANRQTIEAFLEKGMWKIGVKRAR